MKTGERTEKTIALPHADLLRVSRETGRSMDDPWCTRIAALHLLYLVETGEDMEKDIVTVLPADLKRYATEWRRANLGSGRPLGLARSASARRRYGHGNRIHLDDVFAHFASYDDRKNGLLAGLSDQFGRLSVPRRVQVEAQPVSLHNRERFRFGARGAIRQSISRFRSRSTLVNVSVGFTLRSSLSKHLESTRTPDQLPAKVSADDKTNEAASRRVNILVFRPCPHRLHHASQGFVRRAWGSAMRCPRIAG